jgi:hypothetical protein
VPTGFSGPRRAAYSLGHMEKLGMRPGGLGIDEKVTAAGARHAADERATHERFSGIAPISREEVSRSTCEPGAK